MQTTLLALTSIDITTKLSLFVNNYTRKNISNLNKLTFTSECEGHKSKVLSYAVALAYFFKFLTIK